MARTPEAKVKTKAKKILDSLGAYYFMPATGGFGGVRSGGTRFHEGIDIRPVGRAKNGEATDSVFAAMTGVGKVRIRA